MSFSFFNKSVLAHAQSCVRASTRVCVCAVCVWEGEPYRKRVAVIP